MEQVTITLTSLNGNFHPAERVLKLNPDHRSFRIGRASKSPAKGLVSAADNAWFDSPVMSRDHAEIVFNTIDKAVTIQDIGSMHGTFHGAGGSLQSTSRVQPGEARALETGDTLIFGIEVKRGPETFPACSFRIAFDYSESPKNSYSYPESVSEEEEEEEFDDMEASTNDAPSSLDGVSVDNAKPLKASQSIDAIDLTQDEPETSSTTPRAFIHDTMKTIVLIDSDEEEFYSSGSDDHSNALEGEDSSDDSGDSEAGSMMDVGHLRATSELSRVSTDDEVEEGAFVDDPENDMMEDFWSSSADESDQSDIGLSDAEREGLEALFDSGLLPSGREASLNLDDDNDDDEVAPHMKDDTMSRDTTQATRKMTETTQAVFALRDPSPSDAAMVKPATSVTHFTSEVNYSAAPANEWQGLSNLDSSDKARKTAFFEARTINKAKFDKTVLGEAAGRRVPMATYSLTHSTPPYVQNIRHIAPLQGAWADSTRVASKSVLPKLAYLDDHSLLPYIESKKPVAELDMSSAVKFNESRALLEASANVLSASRSGLSIRDIIEVPKSAKRKAEDISDVVDDEVRTWASIPNAEATVSSDSATTSSVPGPKVEVEVSTDSLADSAKVELQIEQRPVKRMKKYVERLGYAALGGAAVGAGLFSVLVATAPNYL